MKRYVAIILTIIFGCTDKEVIRNEGLKLYKNKEYQESIIKLSEYLAINDTSESVLFLRSKAYYMLCDNKKSSKDLHRLIALKNRNWYYYHNLAMLYYLENKLDSSIIYFEKSFEHGSDSYLGRYLLMQSYRYGNKKNEVMIKSKIDNLIKNYFTEEYHQPYLRFEKDFFDENTFNLKGCLDNQTYLMWFPKSHTLKKGDNLEGYLFLMGFLKNQTSEPKFYLLSRNENQFYRRDTLQKLTTDRGVCHFSLRTDNISFIGDTLNHQLFFGAKINYLTKSGVKRDSMFYMVGSVIIKKKIS